MEISKHLTLKELTKSATADRLGIKNDNPNLHQIENLKLLAEKVFEPIRAHFNKPITISSGYRSLSLNQAIKGSITSQHCSGQAIDIDSVSPTNKEIFDYIKKNLEFDQLIWEFGTSKNPDWVHVSYSATKNRKQILKATKLNGKTHYEIFK
jgi:hypothetical protein